MHVTSSDRLNEAYARAEKAEAELAEANAQIAKLQRQHQNDEKTLHMFSNAQIALAEQANRLAARAGHAELELRRFYVCKPISFPSEEQVHGPGCWDYGSEEVHTRGVWHRRPEE
jgi:tRNA A37 threonylcarbamoyladenosine modification protein TsaB